jgi:hypothetical protein
MAKKQSGGRVTAKGTQPKGAAPRGDKPGSGFTPPRPSSGRLDAAPQRSFGSHAPTRAGHHRGNR